MQSSGRKAENAVCKYLEAEGMRILDRNWRNRWCEIDVVAREKSGSIRIIEVKYRQNELSGYGYDYITTEKAARIKQAALAYLQTEDADYGIDVASVSGPDFCIEYIRDAITG